MLNNRNKLIIKGTVLTLIVLALPLFFDYLMAQPPGGPPPGGGPTTGSPPPDCWTPDCIPVDGGLGFLIAAGAALGGRKIYRKVHGS